MTPVKKKFGRPKKDDSAKRSVTVSFAATKEEADQLIVKARRARMDISPWLREQLKQRGVLL